MQNKTIKLIKFHWTWCFKNLRQISHGFVLFSWTVFAISFTIVLVRYSETKSWCEEEARGRRTMERRKKKNPPIFATILLLSPTKKNKKGRLQMVAQKSTIYRMLKCWNVDFELQTSNFYLVISFEWMDDRLIQCNFTILKELVILNKDLNGFLFLKLMDLSNYYCFYT